MIPWAPDSWRRRPAAQIPRYADSALLADVESCLRSAAPLVTPAECMRLQDKLARVARGRGFLLQGGDCAETFAEFGADNVRLAFNLLLAMAAALRPPSGEVVKIGRIAGQLAKPRSADTETVNGRSLPTYRGDIVNGAEPDPSSREPDPMRMLEAHRQSSVTVELIRAYSSAAYADISEFHRKARRRLGLRFDHASTPEDAAEPVRIFTSHEALLLPYEQALTRWDAASERWWSVSAHMLWIGDRTRQIDGAHVEFARGVANTVGLKCGPSLEPEMLCRLIDRLDPERRPGRLVLIGRFGAAEIEERLPALMRASRQAGSPAIWSIDPMHGNTRTLSGRKTRFLSDIVEEIGAFFRIAAAEGVHAGGVHLELTGASVTECLGGSGPVAESELCRNYLTHCDPRLNRDQALDVAAELARLIAGGAIAASDAA